MVSHYSSGRARKRFLILSGILLTINAVVAHTLTVQIVHARGVTINEVKEEQVVLEEAAPITEETEEATGGSDEAPSITLYTVQSGDTISGIAEKHHISANTIRWANELGKNDTIKVGQELVILPINGIQYTVKNGDTISGIAKKFSADQGEILSFNDLDDPKAIQPGVELIIPDAEPTLAAASKPVAKAESKPAAPKQVAIPAPSTPTETTTPTVTLPAPENAVSEKVDTVKEGQHVSDEEDDHHESDTTSIPADTIGGLVNPAPGSVLTQGLHAVNAVDFGGKVGLPIRAAASGTVIVAKGNGAYNGGFGNFIVIAHTNGTKTLYAHLSKVSVSVGQSVDQGDQIGLMGNTGKSTGPHLHFEVHGGKNPWISDKKYTQY